MGRVNKTRCYLCGVPTLNAKRKRCPKCRKVTTYCACCHYCKTCLYYSIACDPNSALARRRPIGLKCETCKVEYTGPVNDNATDSR